MHDSDHAVSTGRTWIAGHGDPARPTSRLGGDGLGVRAGRGRRTTNEANPARAAGRRCGRARGCPPPMTAMVGQAATLRQGQSDALPQARRRRTKPIGPAPRRQAAFGRTNEPNLGRFGDGSGPARGGRRTHRRSAGGAERNQFGRLFARRRRPAGSMQDADRESLLLHKDIVCTARPTHRRSASAPNEANLPRFGGGSGTARGGRRTHRRSAGGAERSQFRAFLDGRGGWCGTQSQLALRGSQVQPAASFVPGGADPALEAYAPVRIYRSGEALGGDSERRWVDILGDRRS